MRGRRLLYAALVLAAVLYYIFHTGYGAWFVLVAVLGFVPLELLLTLPAYWGARLVFDAPAKQVKCGEPYQLRLRLFSRFAMCTVKAKLACENLFTGAGHKENMWLVPGADDTFYPEFRAEACGLVRCTLGRVAMLDVAGLFALPLRRVRPVTVLVRPAPLPAPPTLPPAGGWQSERPTPGTARPGPGSVREFTDVREYRDGDSVRDIHWKLSAKWDKIMVKEASVPIHSAMHLGFDCFGTEAQVRCALARLEALSLALWEMERPHEIVWQTGEELQRQPVFGKPEYDAFLLQLLALPLPQAGQPLAQRAATLAGPFFLVEPDRVVLYERGALREVLV